MLLGYPVACGPPASSSVIPAGSVHKSRGVNAVCMWVLQRGHNGVGCDLASTLC